MLRNLQQISHPAPSPHQKPPVRGIQPKPWYHLFPRREEAELLSGWMIMIFKNDSTIKSIFCKKPRIKIIPVTKNEFHTNVRMVRALLADCYPSVSSMSVYVHGLWYLTSRLQHTTQPLQLTASVVNFTDAQEFIRAMRIVLEQRSGQIYSEDQVKVVQLCSHSRLTRS